MNAIHKRRRKATRKSRTDFDDMLAERRYIIVIWSIDDVREVRPDLTEDQAWDILQECERIHDSQLGFTWTLIRCVAADRFPAPNQ